jgi:nitroreductase
LLKKRALVGFNVLASQKIILAAREARSWRAYAAYLCKPVPKGADLERIGATSVQRGPWSGAMQKRKSIIKAMRAEDDEISIPIGHSAQLTQSLKPILFATR